MKIEKKNRILLLYSWLPTETYHKNLETIFFPKSEKFGPFFFMKNPFYRSKSYLSGRNLAKFHKKEEEALKSGGRVLQPLTLIRVS